MITIENISKSFRGINILNKVSMKINDSDRIVISGPSGSGKTTLLKIIAGLELPDTGKIYFNNELATNKKIFIPANKRQIGFVFQEPALWPHMTVKENIEFGISNISKDQKEQKIIKIAHLLALEYFMSKYPHEISMGEARRASIGRAISVDPKYLIMDEPLVNLNSSLKEQILNSVKKIIHDFTNTLIYVTHDQYEADSIGEKQLTLNNGKIF